MDTEATSFLTSIVFQEFIDDFTNRGVTTLQQLLQCNEQFLSEFMGRRDVGSFLRAVTERERLLQPVPVAPPQVQRVDPIESLSKFKSLIDSHLSKKGQELITIKQKVNDAATKTMELFTRLEKFIIYGQTKDVKFPQFQANLKTILSELQMRKSVRICVTGGMKSGKSSFINGLIKKCESLDEIDILPEDQTKCSARATVITKGSALGYQIVPLADYISGKFSANPILIDVKNQASIQALQSEITLPGERENTAKLNEVVIVYSNSPVLNAGIDIVDLPGFNEPSKVAEEKHPQKIEIKNQETVDADKPPPSQTKTDPIMMKVCKSCIKSADAVVYLFDPTNEWKDSDVIMVQKITGWVSRAPLLIVATKMDTYIRDKMGFIRMDITNNNLDKLFASIVSHFSRNCVFKREDFQQVSLRISDSEVDIFRSKCFERLGQFIEETVRSFRTNAYLLLEDNIDFLLQLLTDLQKENELSLEQFRTDLTNALKKEEEILNKFIATDFTTKVLAISVSDLKNGITHKYADTVDKIKTEIKNYVREYLDDEVKILENQSELIRRKCFLNTFQEYDKFIDAQKIIKKYEIERQISLHFSKNLQYTTWWQHVTKFFNNIFLKFSKTKEVATINVITELLQMLKLDMFCRSLQTFSTMYFTEIASALEADFSEKKQQLSVSLSENFPHEQRLESESSLLNIYIEIHSLSISTNIPITTENLDWKLFDIELHEKLGQGTFGNVFRATVQGNQRAVKLLPKSPTFLFRFQREIYFTHVMTHRKSKRIMKYFGHLQDADNLYMICEYYQNGTLNQFMQKRLNFSTIWQLFLQLLYGVQVLHSANIIHRDLNPNNLLIDETGNLYIGDLGLAVGYDMSTGTYCGTHPYIAPESSRITLKNIQNFDLQKLDSYSVGQIGFFLLKQCDDNDEQSKLLQDICENLCQEPEKRIRVAEAIQCCKINVFTDWFATVQDDASSVLIISDSVVELHNLISQLPYSVQHVKLQNCKIDLSMSTALQGQFENLLNRMEWNDCSFVKESDIWNIFEHCISIPSLLELDLSQFGTSLPFGLNANHSKQLLISICEKRKSKIDVVEEVIRNGAQLKYFTEYWRDFDVVCAATLSKNVSELNYLPPEILKVVEQN